MKMEPVKIKFKDYVDCCIPCDLWMTIHKKYNMSKIPNPHLFQSKEILNNIRAKIENGTNNKNQR